MTPNLDTIESDRQTDRKRDRQGGETGSESREKRGKSQFDVELRMDVKQRRDDGQMKLMLKFKIAY